MHIIDNCRRSQHLFPVIIQSLCCRITAQPQPNINQRKLFSSVVSSDFGQLLSKQFFKDINFDNNLCKKMSSSAKDDCPPSSTDGAGIPMSCDDNNQSVVSAATAVRNVQTQHGDYRCVDQENTFVIKHLVFDEKVPVPWVSGASDNDDDNAERPGPSAEVVLPVDDVQVVWVEPFNADGTEVSLFLFVI